MDSGEENSSRSDANGLMFPPIVPKRKSMDLDDKSGRLGRKENGDSSDSAPEVEFGAFRRKNRGSLYKPLITSVSSSAISYSTVEPRQITSKGKAAPQLGRMRAGAPRLGGLGLGGIGATAGASSSSNSQMRRKKSSKRAQPVSPPIVRSESTLFPHNNLPSTTVTTIIPSNERPFLYPELARTTARAGAFVLDRPAPDSLPQQYDDDSSPPSSPDFSDRSNNRSSVIKMAESFERADHSSDDERNFGGRLGRLQDALAGELSSDESFRSAGSDRIRSDRSIEPGLVEGHTHISPVQIRALRTSTPPTVDRAIQSPLTLLTTPPLSLRRLQPQQPSPQSILVDHLRAQRTSDSPESFFLSLENHYRGSTEDPNATDSATTTESTGPRTPPLSPSLSPSSSMSPHMHARLLQDEGAVQDARFAADVERMQPLIEKLGPNLASTGIEMTRQVSDTRSFDSAMSDHMAVTLPLLLTRRSPALSATSVFGTARSRGPPPPRPKRLRRPTLETNNSSSSSVEIGGGSGSGTGSFGSNFSNLTRTRGLFATGDDIEDDGGGGGSAGVRDISRGEYRDGGQYNYQTSSYLASRVASSTGGIGSGSQQSLVSSTRSYPPSRLAPSTGSSAPFPQPPASPRDKLSSPPTPAHSVLLPSVPLLDDSPYSPTLSNMSYSPPVTPYASTTTTFSSSSSVTLSREISIEPVTGPSSESMSPDLDLQESRSLTPLLIAPAVEDASDLPLVAERERKKSYRGLRLPSSLTPSASVPGSLASLVSPNASMIEFAAIPASVVIPHHAVPISIAPQRSPPPTLPVVIERVQHSSSVVIPPSAVVESAPSSPSTPLLELEAPLRQLAALSTTPVIKAPPPPPIVRQVIAPDVSTEMEVFEDLSDQESSHDEAVCTEVVAAITSTAVATSVAIAEPAMVVEKESEVRPDEADGSVDNMSRGGSGITTSAVLGVVASGGVALGYGAWHGVSAVASLSKSSLRWGWKRFAETEVAVADVLDASLTTILAPSPTFEDVATMVSTPRKALPGNFAVESDSEADEGDSTFYQESVTIIDRGEEEVPRADGTESSIIETEFGEMHFPAPEGFLDDLRKAMLEVGEEDLAASELAEQVAQEAAYLSANRAHHEAEESSTTSSPSDEVISYSAESIDEARRRKRSSIASSRSSRTIQTRLRVDDANAELLSDEEGEEADAFPDIPARPTSRYLTPNDIRPGVQRRASSTNSSNSSSKGDGSSFKKRNSFFGSIGRKRNDSDSISVTSTNQGPFPLVGGSTHSSNEASRDRDRELRRNSILPPFPYNPIDSSASTKSRRIMSGAPSVESDIGDATYVSYSSGKTRRNTSESGSLLSFSRGGGVSGMTDSQLLARNSRVGDKKSSLRVISRYHGARSATFMPPSPTSVYSVRFANATRGLGLKSVAESEAVRAGGEQHAMRWTGVGRGRYGNMLLQVDASSDNIFAEQAEVIKKKWRTFGSSVDWGEVKID